jgi:Cro/C1-type helix-turn-helix DNA-binding protein
VRTAARSSVLALAFKNGRARAVRFTTLATLCEVLECQPGDLLRWEAGTPQADDVPQGGRENMTAPRHRQRIEHAAG